MPSGVWYAAVPSPSPCQARHHFLRSATWLNAMVTKVFSFHPQISQMAQGRNDLYNTVDGSEIKNNRLMECIKPCKKWNKLPTFILFTTVTEITCPNFNAGATGHRVLRPFRATHGERFGITTGGCLDGIRRRTCWIYVGVMKWRKVRWMEEIRLTSWYGEYPITCRVLYIPGGCLGFLPSIVFVGDGISTFYKKVFVFFLQRHWAFM